jgi:hypothetical protein
VAGAAHQPTDQASNLPGYIAKFNPIGRPIAASEELSAPEPE